MLKKDNLTVRFLNILDLWQNFIKDLQFLFLRRYIYLKIYILLFWINKIIFFYIFNLFNKN